MSNRASRPTRKPPESISSSSTTSSTAPPRSPTPKSLITRNVDFVIEFQTDANFGATIMQKMKEAEDPGGGDRHSDAGSDLLRRQQSEGRLHGRLLSRAGRGRPLRRRSRQERLFPRGRIAAIGTDPENAHRRPGRRFPRQRFRLRSRPCPQIRQQEHAGGELHPDQFAPRQDSGRRRHHGHRDQRSGDDRHPARRLAGRAQGPHRRRPRRRRDGDA